MEKPIPQNRTDRKNDNSGDAASSLANQSDYGSQSAASDSADFGELYGGEAIESHRNAEFPGYENADEDTNPVTKWSLMLIGLLTMQIILLYGPTVAWLWDRWTLSVWQHAHGLLILPVVGYLVFIQLRKVRHLPPCSSAWGFAVLIPALVLHMLDAGMHTQLLSAFALIVALPGFSLVFLGLERTKSILFPLVFLIFTLPIPLVFTESLHLFLRKIAVVSATYIIPIIGIPMFTEGTTLHITNGSLQVADACSGFSTLYATVAIAFLMAYISTDNRRRILVLLSAAPIAIAANIVRVVLLVLLVNWKGIDVLGTSLHTISGLFTFAMALPLIFWLGYTAERRGQE